MAWIESHQNLERHPKRSALSAAMNWSKPETIGRLHMLWWWVLDFADDGDLSKFNDAQIAEAMGVATADAGNLVKALVQACWLEREPYFRVRNWWRYAGKYLQVKNKGNSSAWMRVRDKYREEDENQDETGVLQQPPLQPLQQPPLQPLQQHHTLTLDLNLNQDLRSLDPLSVQGRSKGGDPQGPRQSDKGDKALSGAKLERHKSELAAGFEAALGIQWLNDAGKWVNRIKERPGRCERVLAEVRSAVKEGRVNTTAAQYAEQIWKEFA